MGTEGWKATQCPNLLNPDSIMSRSGLRRKSGAELAQDVELSRVIGRKTSLAMHSGLGHRSESREERLRQYGLQNCKPAASCRSFLVNSVSLPVIRPLESAARSASECALAAISHYSFGQSHDKQHSHSRLNWTWRQAIEIVCDECRELRDVDF